MEKIKVYIVDDDDDDLENLQEAFLMASCAREILLYHTVPELLKQLDEDMAKPDLIVLDHQSPGMNGAEALQILRDNPAYEQTALCIYSSYITTNKAKELEVKGADLCLAKGVTMQAIQQHALSFCEAAAKRMKVNE